MRRVTIAAVAFAGVPLFHISAQRSVPVDLKILTNGLTVTDSARVVSAVRRGIETDSLFHVVYRPPRDSLKYSAGREFEVAPIRIVATVESTNGHPALALEATDVVSQKQLARSRSELPPGLAILAAGDSARAFAKVLAKVSR